MKNVQIANYVYRRRKINTYSAESSFNVYKKQKRFSDI